MALALLFIVFGVAATLLNPEADTFLHLRHGEDIWRTGRIPHTDSYSFTGFGERYTPHEWLSQVLLYLAYATGGVPLVELVSALAILTAVGLMFRLMVGPPMTRFIVMLWLTALSATGWSPRPQMFTWLALASLITVLVAGRFRLIPLLFLVWANMHAAVLLGNVVLAAVTGAAAVRAWRWRDPADVRRLRALALVLPLAVLATAATPIGFYIFAHAFETAERCRALGIGEWIPTLPPDPLAIAFWLAAIPFLVVFWVRRRALLAVPPGDRSPSWTDWVLAASVLAVLPLAVGSIRNISPFLLLATPTVTRLLGPDFRFRRRARPPSPDYPRANLAIVGVAGAAAVAVVLWFWVTLPRSFGWRPIPEPALAALRACEGPLYNHYNEGGYLIGLLREKRVFADGRQDLYPLPLLLEHFDVEHERKPYRPLFERWGIRCAFLSLRSPTVRALSADGWQTRFRDDKYAVLVAPR